MNEFSSVRKAEHLLKFVRDNKHNSEFKLEIYPIKTC
jgi:hypothetical protein